MPRNHPADSRAMPYGPRHFRGPSQAFVALTRNPNLESPARFEPTVKAAGDVVI